MGRQRPPAVFAGDDSSSLAELATDRLHRKGCLDPEQEEEARPIPPSPNIEMFRGGR